MAQVPGSSDDAADELAVDPLGLTARGTASTAHAARCDERIPAPTPEAMRWLRVLRLDRRRLRAILAPLRAEPLIVGSSLVAASAVDARSPAEDGGRVAETSPRGALHATGGAVELVAVDRPE